MARSIVNVVFHNPTTSVRNVCAVLRRNRMEDGPGGPPVPERELALGAVYTRPFADRTDSRELAEELVAVAGDGCSFRAWTVPAEDYLGLLVRYTPSLGSHEAACDARGRAVYYARDLLTVRNDIDAILGTRWDALAPAVGR